MQSYFHYWGKAGKPEDDSGRAFHLLPYHCLDVAAVGSTYLRQANRLRKFISESVGLDEEALIEFFGYLLALHDLGKFSYRFQGQRTDLLWCLQQKTCAQPYTVRHDSLGYACWQKYLFPRLKRQPVFARLGNRGIDYWASVVMGHHGKPPLPRKSATNPGFLVDGHFCEDDRIAAEEFADAIRELFWADALEECLFSLDPKAFVDQSRICSWWLAGLTIVSDWLGSNQDFFSYRPEPLPLSEYWSYAQQQAENALAKTDLLPAIAASDRNPEDLFPFLDHARLTPLQSVASAFSVAREPQLFVLEDVTGAGKTEAAVILANRLMAAGQSDGIYFALPTMATSNAMYRRMQKVYQQLFDANSKPSLVLAHGSARLSAGFNASIIPIDSGVDDERMNSVEESASARCNAWFADHRKKALLAHVGVGTIDQALLAVLYSKHQSLRVLGLFGKLLVIDEVHACDAYMLGLLEKLLTLHACGGGSALLLSATLPLSTRQKLADAFRRGLGLETQSLRSMAYPLLTRIRPSSVPQELPVGTRPEVARQVAIECQSDEMEVFNALKQTLDTGGCACWIRNTVADALETYVRFQNDQRFESSRIHLFHARFTTGDRVRIEETALTRFGKDSKAEQRAGHLLIATQVVEQSLDVDFDLLVTDLAPIDLLIQRAGRLRRHARDIAGNPLRPGEADQRGLARMIVFGPLAASEIQEDWFQSFFPKGGAVYPDHGQLWLTANLLAEQNGFRMPQDARTLIEGVYGDDAESRIPEALLGKIFDAEADRLNQKSAVKFNAVALDQGYRAGEDKWWEDKIALTRLGEETHSLLLARWQDGYLLPWHEGEDGWQLSEIRVRRALLVESSIKDPALRKAADELKPSLPGRGRWSIVLPLTQTEDAWQCSGIDGKGRDVRVTYSASEGLKVEA